MGIIIFLCFPHRGFNSHFVFLLHLSVTPSLRPSSPSPSQILNTLSPQGESLAVLARELGSKVYNRYITQRKLRSRQLEKVQEIYEDYIHLLAKDSQVGTPGRGPFLGPVG